MKYRNKKGSKSKNSDHSKKHLKGKQNDKDQEVASQVDSFQQQQINHQNKENSNLSNEQQLQHMEQDIQKDRVNFEQQQNDEPKQQQYEQAGHQLVENQRNFQQYQQQLETKGILYMSRVPPYMTPNFIRKLLVDYGVQRIYLLPQSQWARKNRIKNGGSKRICFREGWIQFSDKKNAKMAALALNGQKMVHKKGTFYSEDVWNLKYLPKFKWHHLTEKLAHEQRLKKQHLRLEMEQQRKLQQHYSTQVHKSKMIRNIIKNKISKGKTVKQSVQRNYGQRKMLEQLKD